MTRVNRGVFGRLALLMVVGLLVLVAGSGSAFADSVVVFTGSGTSAMDGRPQNGSATFSIVDNGGGNFVLTITLENTAGPGQLGGVSSVLYGLRFTLSGGGTLSFSSASGVASAYDCSSGSCVSEAPDAAPYGWTYGGSGWLSGSGDALQSPNPPMSAPFNGIVNDNITATDGLTQSGHNPLLVGPVTFTFLLTGGPTNGDPTVSDVLFFFGTTGESVPGRVPEPTTLLLLGAGLLGLGVLAKRVR